MIPTPILIVLSLSGFVTFCMGNYAAHWKLAAIGLAISVVPVMLVFLETFLELWRSR